MVRPRVDRFRFFDQTAAAFWQQGCATDLQTVAQLRSVRFAVEWPVGSGIELDTYTDRAIDRAIDNATAARGTVGATTLRTGR